MRWSELRSVSRDLPYFTEGSLHSSSTTPSLRNQLSSWVKRGQLWRLRKGTYTLPTQERRAGLSARLASNVLYAPSYVSLEYVLSLYGLIPEKVAQVTAVTTRKTARFSNPIGSFSFRHVKRDLFFGYTDQKDENGAAVLVATPEKALLDKIYLDAPARLTREYLAEGLRLQNEEVLQIRRMRTYARRFRSDKIDEAVRLLSKR